MLDQLQLRNVYIKNNINNDDDNSLFLISISQYDVAFS